MRHLTRYLTLILLLVFTGLFAVDWTPASIIPIGPDSTVVRTYNAVFNSPYERPQSFGFNLTAQQIKDAGATVKAPGQVYTHGIVAYYHGIAVGRIAGNGRYFADREFLVVGLIPQVDALYFADPTYMLQGKGQYWYPDFLNAYKGRWEAKYNPSVSFGNFTRDAIVYSLRIEEFIGIDPRSSMLSSGVHQEGSPVPPPAVNN